MCTSLVCLTCIKFVRSPRFSGQEADEMSVNSATIRKEAPCQLILLDSTFNANLAPFSVWSAMTGYDWLAVPLRLRALRVRRLSLRPIWIAWSGAFKAGRRARRGNHGAKVEKSKSRLTNLFVVCFLYCIVHLYQRIFQRQFAQTLDGASTVSKAISGISRLGKLGSSGTVMPTCKVRKADVSDVNQSEFWLFPCVFSFSQLFAILAFFNVCQQTKTWCFATFSWTSTSEIGRIFTDFLVFFFEFSFRCAQIVTGWFGSSKILVEAVHWLESKEQESPGKRERATQSVKKRLTQYHKYTCCSPLGCFQHVCEATVKCEQVNVWAPKVQHLWLENNS